MTKANQEVNASVKDGDSCLVVGGVHKGKTGTARDLNVSKTGHLTITVVQESGERFKTLAKNVVVRPVDVAQSSSRPGAIGAPCNTDPP